MEIEKSDTIEPGFATIPEIESPNDNILSELYEMFETAT
jgi:hypothetical protein